MDKRFDNELFFCAYILEQSWIDISEIQFPEYLNLLPIGFEQFPIFFNDEELEYLKGSVLKSEIQLLKSNL